jgi:hypothetical protein
MSCADATATIEKLFPPFNGIDFTPQQSNDTRVLTEAIPDWSYIYQLFAQQREAAIYNVNILQLHYHYY